MTAPASGWPTSVEGPVEGPAFPLAVRVLATALVAWTGHWGWKSRDALVGVEWSGSALMPLLGAVALVLWCLVWIWRSRIRVDGQGLHQSWMWDKQVRWADVTQARLVMIPGLGRLLAPRLVVRARGQAFALVFHCGDPQVLALICAVLVGSGKVPAKGP